MTNKDDRATWAESLDSFGPDARLTSGDESRERVRADLEAALGGSDGLKRALRGRPSLRGTGQALGDHAPKVTVRLTPKLDEALLALVKSQQRKRSDVVRDALEEYAARHSA